MARFNTSLSGKTGFLTILLLTVMALPSLQAQFRGTGYKRKGFTDLIEFGVIVPSNIYKVGFEAQNIFGVQAGPHWAFGPGVGINVYSSDYLITGIAHARYFFLEDSEYTPFIGADVGYAYGFEKLKGGLTYTPSVGMKYWLDTRVGIYGSFGYKVQYIPENFVGPAAGIGQTNKTMTSFLFRIGMQF